MFVNLNPKELEQIQDIKFIGGWEDGNDVFLWHRVNGQRKIVRIPDVHRYFCVAREDFLKADKSIWQKYKSDGLYDKGVLSGKYAYIYSNFLAYKSTWNTFLTQLEDNGLKPLEGDINRLQRLVIDYQLQVAGPQDDEKPHIVYFDIETDDSGEEIHIGGDRIVSMAWKDGQTGEEFFLALEAMTDESEKDLLMNFYKSMAQYDVRVGYNNYGFDDEYLLKRFERYHFDLSKWKRIASLDIFNIFERQGTYRKYEVRNRKLDTIGKAVLNRGKIDHTEKIIELWTNNKEKLKEYNIEDVKLIYDMEQVLGSVNLVLSVCSFAGLLHSLNYSPAKTVDTFLLRSAQRRRNSGSFDFRYATSYYRPEHMATGKFGAWSRNALPSDKRKGRKEILEDEFGIEYEPVQGAFVMDAEPGLYQNVYAFDFQSLYPNTIRAFNIGHDTLVDENFDGPKNQAPNGAYYRTDFNSGMADDVTFLLDKRRSIRAQAKLENNPVKKKALDILQNGVKELTNSFYGVTAQYGGRHYSKQIAESITSGGRTFLPFGDEYMSARGHKVVIGDTDSLYISVKDNTDPEQLVSGYLDALYEMMKRKYNVFHPEYLKMAYEKRMESVLIIAKKLYSGWVVMEDGKPIDGKLVNKGLMLLKNNYPRWGTNICLEVLTDLLSNKYLNPDHYIRIIQREKDKLASGKVDYHELMVNARLGKAVDKYENENALCHVRIAKRLIEKGELVPVYSTISYLVTQGERNVKSERLPIEGVAEQEINNETRYDAVHYFNHVLMEQLESLLTPVFPEIDWKSFKYPTFLKKNNYFELKVKVNG